MVPFNYSEAKNLMLQQLRHKLGEEVSASQPTARCVLSVFVRECLSSPAAVKSLPKDIFIGGKFIQQKMKGKIELPELLKRFKIAYCWGFSPNPQAT